ncbi:OLC1v1030932C1 [Oldenlandia corymbosa var. corymbosa]|uniref:OLC1v1030932C1 n=1 Tax=Oldenlandia corymbosa var. corymbosa TaxID=529605 RepID=A0AAV1CJ16_OLDCO|nr:OLC1v1030932C1 [Oldenlandia corymbosa var. corymbosa]
MDDRNFGRAKMQTFVWDNGDTSVSVTYKENFYIFHFTIAEHLLNVLRNGPYIIDGALVVLRRWVSSLSFKHLGVEEILIWVRFYDFPITQLRKTSAFDLAAMIGESVEVEDFELKPSQMSFLRMSVWMKPFKPLIPGFYHELLDGDLVWIECSYESVFEICRRCCKIGHPISRCTTREPLKKRLRFSSKYRMHNNSDTKGLTEEKVLDGFRFNKEVEIILSEMCEKESQPYTSQGQETLPKQHVESLKQRTTQVPENSSHFHRTDLFRSQRLVDVMSFDDKHLVGKIRKRKIGAKQNVSHSYAAKVFMAFMEGYQGGETLQPRKKRRDINKHQGTEFKGRKRSRIELHGHEGSVKKQRKQKEENIRKAKRTMVLEDLHQKKKSKPNPKKHESTPRHKRALELGTQVESLHSRDKEERVVKRRRLETSMKAEMQENLLALIKQLVENQNNIVEVLYATRRIDGEEGHSTTRTTMDEAAANKEGFWVIEPNQSPKRPCEYFLGIAGAYNVHL